MSHYSIFSTGSEFTIRWFTPTSEVPLCGHATLASSAVILFCKSKLYYSTITSNERTNEQTKDFNDKSLKNLSHNKHGKKHRAVGEYLTEPGRCHALPIFYFDKTKYYFDKTNYDFVKTNCYFDITKYYFVKTNYDFVKTNCYFDKTKYYFDKTNYDFVKTNCYFDKTKYYFVKTNCYFDKTKYYCVKTNCYFEQNEIRFR